MQVNKIQNIQGYNPNFVAGRVFFVTKYNNSWGYTDKVEKHFQKSSNKLLKELRKLIKGKPYDLYLSRSEKQPEFYNIAANTSHYNIVNGSEIERTPKTYLVHENAISYALIDGVKSVMAAYEQLLKAH